MPAQTHIIHRQTLDVQIDDREQAHDIQQRLSWVYRHDVAPRLEALFDRLADGDTVLRLDRLELDLGHFTVDELEAGFVEKLLHDIERALREEAMGFSAQPAGRPAEQNTRAEDTLDIWLYFLQHGALPWHARIDDWETWEGRIIDALENKDAPWQQFVEVLRRDPHTIDRLVRQFDRKVIYAVLRLVDESAVSPVAALEAMFERVKETMRRTFAGGRFDSVFWETVCIELLARENRDSRWERVVRVFVFRLAQRTGISPHKLVDQIKPDWANRPAVLSNFAIELVLAGGDGVEGSEPELSTKGQEELASEWHIGNAGLVLLHPFLRAYFEKVGLVVSDEFKTEDARRRAINLTQFLATGRWDAPEFHTTLNKLLCGVPLNEPVDRLIEPTKDEIQEADRLLSAVIEYWTALGSSSPDGLRVNFLMREGRLSRISSGWKLEVEKKTHDILLNRLPWGLSMIKYPWMKEMLHVDWG